MDVARRRSNRREEQETPIKPKRVQPAESTASLKTDEQCLLDVSLPSVSISQMTVGAFFGSVLPLFFSLGASLLMVPPQFPDAILRRLVSASTHPVGGEENLALVTPDTSIHQVCEKALQPQQCKNCWNE